MRGEYEYLEIPREEYERLQQALRDMEMPFLSVSDFVDKQIRVVLEKYDEWLGRRDEYERKSRKMK